MKKTFVLAGSALLVALLLASCQKGGAASSVTSSAASSAASSTTSSATTSSAASSTTASSTTSSATSSATTSVSSSTASSSASSLSKKSLITYLNSADSTQAMDYYFQSDNPDVPFLDTTTILGFLNSLKGYQSNENSTLTVNGDVLTMSLEDGQQAFFDFGAKTITFPNAEKFFARSNEATCLDSFGTLPTDASGAPTYLKKAKDPYLVAGHAMVANLGEHEIPMILENGVGYIPLATFSDVFANNFSFQFFSNGVNAFISSNRDMVKNRYYEAKTGERSEAFANFIYHEFCLNGDFNYALKAKHGITTFDDFLTRTGRKEGLLSKDPQVADATLAYVLLTDLDDNHSSTVSPSYLSGSSFNVHDSKYKGTSNTYWDEHHDALTAARSSAFPKGFPVYQEVGTTAFVTFDEFTSIEGDYYTSFPSEEDAAKDTFALIEYAHKKINEDKMTSVVLDLTCNSGGAATAAAYVASWMLGGSATLHFSALLDDAKASFPMSVDVNLDKNFDSSDGISDKKLYCLTSSISFSSGNLVPSAFKSSAQVTMVSQTSGGGACVVDSTCLADGTAFNFSGSRAVCTVKNGVYYDVDQGVIPDYSITDIANFYDRTTLASYLATLK